MTPVLYSLKTFSYFCNKISKNSKKMPRNLHVQLHLLMIDRDDYYCTVV